MKKAFIFILLGLVVSVNAAQAQDRTILNLKKLYFQCPPCNLPCDTVHFAAAGACSTCGMRLYAAYRGYENTQGKHAEYINKKVAVLIFPGVEIIDFTGPWEVFGAAGMEVYSVSSNDEAVRTSMGMKIKPDYTFKNAPVPDIVLVPGGNVDISDLTTVDWVLKTSKQSQYTMSVCTGAFYLAAAGLLDNQKATTNYPAIEQLRQLAPSATVLDSVRFVDNGSIITSAGLSSGIDAALHLVSLYVGKAQTKKMAVELEYAWNDEQQFVRGKLADKYARDVLNVFTPFDYELTTYKGDEQKWQVSLKVNSQLSKQELQSLVEFQLKEAMDWKPAEVPLQWKLTNENIHWKSALELQETAKNTFVVHFNVQKV